VVFFFSSRRRHTRFSRDWSSDVCSSDLLLHHQGSGRRHRPGPVRLLFHHHQQPQGPDGGRLHARPGHAVHPAPAPGRTAHQLGTMTDMGYRLSKIYTRTGDAGQTGLADGRRVPKDHPRIEAIGEVDSLNSLLGVLLAELDEARARHPGLAELIEVLTPCQHRLFDLGGELAMPEYQALDAAEIARLEEVIDRWNEEVGPLENF